MRIMCVTHGESQEYMRAQMCVTHGESHITHVRTYKGSPHCLASGPARDPSPRGGGLRGPAAPAAPRSAPHSGAGSLPLPAPPRARLPAGSLSGRCRLLARPGDPLSPAMLAARGVRLPGGPLVPWARRAAVPARRPVRLAAELTGATSAAGPSGGIRPATGAPTWQRRGVSACEEGVAGENKM